MEINGNEFKLSQYAEDTTLILDGSKESCLESLVLIETFGNVSGLRLNIKKTEALWIGSKKIVTSNVSQKKISNGQRKKLRL